MSEEDEKAWVLLARMGLGCSAMVAIAAMVLIVWGVVGFVRWIG